jgi:recombination protein RecR
VNSILPDPLVKLIDALGVLPGVGSRTAERYAYFLLKTSQQSREKLADSLLGLSRVKYCPITFALIDDSQEISPLYDDPSRDKKQIAIVEEPLDIIALEKTKMFHGTYHVLGGVISPIDNIGPEQLHIPELIARLKKDEAREVILATNAGVEGESTALYLNNQIKHSGLNVTVTRLARGIPIGVDLEYTDQITLGHAFEGRQEV